jgi:fused signal recognition particle receptor|tara:strand:+ start:618 stop:1754 length:1137 start_codon:yes stop_codon:yes gene_type:complete
MNFFNKFFSKKKKISNQPLTEGKLVTDESLKKSVSKEISNTDLKESIIEAKSIDVVDETTNNKTDKVLVNTKKESLNKGLKISSQSFFSKISKAIIGKSKVNDEVLDDLEEILISSDVGVKTTLKIIDRIENRVAKDKYISTDELDLILKEEIISIISDDEESVNNLIINKNNNPHVILIVGVNGAGKTTSIGKMANYYKSLGLKVVIGAADTFRAAAIEQLEVWANRVKVDLIKQEMGSDPASVAFDTLESAIKKDADIVLIDTAGRLHNKVNLMNELSKIKRVLKKKAFDAPNEVILVIDGSTGQNAFEQAKQFTKVTEITSLIITKLDGTAKGGVVLGISDQFQIPIKFVGVGEKIEDLQIFDKKEFVDSFFKKS